MLAADLIIVPLECEALAIKSLKRFLQAFKELQKNIEPGLRLAGILLTMYDDEILSISKYVNRYTRHLETQFLKQLFPIVLIFLKQAPWV